MNRASKEPTRPNTAPPTPPYSRFNFSCSLCGSVLEARISQSGALGRCPTCSAVFNIPRVDPRTGLALGDADSAAALQDPTPVHAYAAAGEKAPAIVPLESGGQAICCPRCNANNDIEENFCATCGFPFTIEVANRAATLKADPYAVGALITGLVSLPLSLCSHPIGGLVAFVAAILAWTALNRVTAGGRGAGSRRWIFAGLVPASIAMAIALVGIIRRL